MGAFTTDPAIAQKFLSAGIPVWLMRHPDMITADVVIKTAIFDFDTPDTIVLDYGPFPSSPIYVGMAGARHLAATSLGGHTYLDVEKTPVPDLDHPSILARAPQPLRKPASPSVRPAEEKKTSEGGSAGSVIRQSPSRARPCPCKFHISRTFFWLNFM